MRTAAIVSLNNQVVFDAQGNISTLDGSSLPTEVEIAAEIKRLEAEAHNNRIKKQTRSTIQETAGDSLSLLGTTSDSTHLLFYLVSLLIYGFRNANSLDELRAVAEPFADIAEDFLAKVESGETKLPFIKKGLRKVVDDMATRATAVTEALELKDKLETEKVEVAKSQVVRSKIIEPQVIKAQVAKPVESTEKIQNVNKQNLNKYIVNITDSNKKIGDIS